MRYAKQKAASKRLEPRNRHIRAYSIEHPDSSQEDIGRVFKLTGQQIGVILKQEKARLATRAAEIAQSNINAEDSLVER